jgi:hypothetical protein
MRWSRGLGSLAGILVASLVEGQTTWTPIGFPSTLGLVPDPGDPSAIYFLTSGGILRYQQSSQITTPLGGPVGGLVVSPSNLQRLYVVTSSAPLELWKSSDRGTTWTDMTAHLPTFFDQLVFGLLAVDPNDPDIVYASFTTRAATRFEYTNRGVYRSADGGNSWTLVKPPSSTDVFAGFLALAPGSRATLFDLTCAGVFRSMDGGSSWASSVPETPGYGCGGLQIVLVDPRTSSTVYVAGPAGVFRSLDGGDSWSRIGIGDSSWSTGVNSLAIDPNAPSTLVAATNGFGILRTTDGGAIWESFNSGLPCFYASAIDPCVLGSTLPLAFTRTKPSVAYASFGGIFRTGLSSSGSCVPSGFILCVGQGRFAVNVDWSPLAGVSWKAYPVVITTNAAGFWFFGPDNLEVVVKVLDGRSINGHFWAFSGALSNVEYTITITDTQTGLIRKYFNPKGTLASVADTSAF